MILRVLLVPFISTVVFVTDGQVLLTAAPDASIKVGAPVVGGEKASEVSRTLGSVTVVSTAGDEEASEGVDEHLAGEDMEEHVAEEVHSVTYAMAVMLMLFMFVNMSLLFLINHNVATVRHASYQMISTTASVFCAVLFNQTIFAFLFKQVLRGDPNERMFTPWGTKTLIPRGIGNDGPFPKFVLGACLFFITLYALNKRCCIGDPVSGSVGDDGWAGRLWRMNENEMYAVQKLYGHVCAFAGIHLFGDLQMVLTTHVPDSCVFLVLMCILVAAIAWWVAALKGSECMRQKWIRGDLEALVEVMSPSGLGAKNPSWAVVAKEGEDDGMALNISFLALQMCVYTVHGEFTTICGQEKVRTTKQIGELLLFFLGGLFVVTVWGCARGDELPRWADITQSCIMMTCAWCFLRMGGWIFRIWITDRHMGQVGNAVAITAVSVILITALDSLIDKCSEKRKRRNQSHVRREIVVVESDRNVTNPGSNSTSLSAGYASIEPPALDEAFKATERSMMKITETLGVAVGLAWDMAFEGADEAIIEGSVWTASHPVIWTAVVNIILFSVVYVGWQKFIAPKARITAEAHQKIIDATQMFQLARGYKQGDLIKVIHTSSLSIDDTLHEGDVGLVTGAPIKNSRHNLKCDFRRFKGVSVPARHVRLHEFPKDLQAFDLVGSVLWRDKKWEITWQEDSKGLITGGTGRISCSRLREPVRAYTYDKDFLDVKFSALSRVTLPKEGTGSRFEVGISEFAEHFAFAYPAVECELNEEVVTATDLAFLSAGGFVYFDRDMKLVDMMAVVPRKFGGLRFKEPRKWKKQWTDSFSGRFVEVTLPMLKEKGVDKFCWLSPEEKFGTEVLCKHGGFAYLFKEAGEGVYFPVNPGSCDPTGENGHFDDY